jgi:hypothetical protein
VKRPKRLGGLGVLDLERFSRALHLRWLWFWWADPDRPLVGLEAPCNEEDKQLFRASTVVTVGMVVVLNFGSQHGYTAGHRGILLLVSSSLPGGSTKRSVTISAITTGPEDYGG